MLNSEEPLDCLFFEFGVCNIKGSSNTENKKSEGVESSINSSIWEGIQLWLMLQQWMRLLRVKQRIAAMSFLQGVLNSWKGARMFKTLIVDIHPVLSGVQPAIASLDIELYSCTYLGWSHQLNPLMQSLWKFCIVLSAICATPLSKCIFATCVKWQGFTLEDYICWVGWIQKLVYLCFHELYNVVPSSLCYWIIGRILMGISHCALDWDDHPWFLILIIMPLMFSTWFHSLFPHS